MSTTFHLPLLLCFLASCTQADLPPPPTTPPGEKPELDIRLKKVISNSGFASSEETEEFFYDSEGKLVSIENDRLKQTLVYQYDTAGLLVKRLVIRSYSTPPDTFPQYYFYDSMGHLQRKETYGSDGLPHNKYLFETDEFGRITEQQFYLKIDTALYSFRYEYIWDGDNVIQQNDYDPNGNILHEWFNEYDQYLNPFCYTAQYIELPTSRNNLIKSTAVDHTGLLDLVANPIEFSIEYQEDGLPEKIDANWGRSQVFEYE